MFQRLKQEGQLSLIFADDSYLPTDSELECQKNVNASMSLLFKLVFVIHSDRSDIKSILKWLHVYTLMVVDIMVIYVWYNHLPYIYMVNGYIILLKLHLFQDTLS